MWAYAFVLAKPYGSEPFEPCIGPGSTIMLTEPDVIVGDPGRVYDVGTYDNEPTVGMPVLAAVLLGSTNLSLWSERDVAYFTATADDLTPEGVALLDALQALYERPVAIVTFLDT